MLQGSEKRKEVIMLEQELQCNVCEERTAVGVAAVPGIPMSCAYCRECLVANAHPLGIVIANTACCGGYDRCSDWWQHMVDCTLAHLGKTREWFDVQVLEQMFELDHMEDDAEDGVWNVDFEE